MSGPAVVADPRARSAADTREPLLEIDRLQIDFVLRHGVVHAVRDVSLSIYPGESVALVGESGSGKSVTALAAMGLLKLPGKIRGGDIRWKGASLLGDSGAESLRRVRGKDLAIVFQDPMTSLNPLFTVGTQLTEVLRRHLNMTKGQAKERAAELLDLVGISSPRERLRQYPHEFSGGMRQRALIAMALACEPELLIADEPTTALDVTIQAQILELVAEIRDRLGLAVLMITHDLGVVAGLCQRVAVMYAGKIVEEGPIDEMFADPRHPYTRGLLASTPRLDSVAHRLTGIAGSPPRMDAPPPGCAFAARCSQQIDRCLTEPPALLLDAETGRRLACWHSE
ncbi:ABC transporter ATP-binding protein [Jatrophihabitans cynanchi]|jgi:oligopeptide/dipeptide ABC transporter ATP-binding protein|uniref:ABC transporter ATP-binding protein n=1 Tax=Jatrophihabitans cynanchi TaxID=2944128 RepID=A0ABY7K586_9ACTN|nr:ABC transporter ATP-binding protein [Jatrophihabitans sp. SB3-54]WAX58266.1 ABC transporter ATP-binding protein [Jatrophihabitans sp. SB3-54]